MLVLLVVAFIVGAIVYFIGSFFDRTPENRWAGLAGLIAFLLVFLGRSGFTL